MDKNRFRNISFCAIGALLALAFVQAWSLWRMYADRAEEFSRKVTLAMNRAAYDDLLMGNRRRTSQTRTSVVTTGNIDSVKLDMIDTISVKSLGAAGKVLSIRSKVDTLRTNIALRRGDKTRYIYQEVRMPSFTALQFNLSRYDSLLTRYLADSGIGLPHSVDVIRGGTTGMLPKSGSTAWRRGQRVRRGRRRSSPRRRTLRGYGTRRCSPRASPRTTSCFSG